MAPGRAPWWVSRSILATPLIAFLVVEERLARASRAIGRTRLFYELPVVAEQLAMLISAGFSLTASLDRIAARGGGACATDLSRVGVRIRQGLGEDRALVEWGAIANVDAVDRLVSVLALNREKPVTSDGCSPRKPARFDARRNAG